MFILLHYLKNFQGSLSSTLYSWIPLMDHPNLYPPGPQPFLQVSSPVFPPTLVPRFTEVLTIPFAGFCLSNYVLWHMLCLSPIFASFICKCYPGSTGLCRSIWKGHLKADLQNNQGRRLGERCGWAENECMFKS